MVALETPQLAPERRPRRTAKTPLRMTTQEYRQYCWNHQTEEDLRQLIKPMSITLGYLHYHTWSSLHSDDGFPDEMFVHTRTGRVIYAELKTETGRTSLKQDLWLDVLSRSPNEVYLWRPSMIDDITEILQRGL